jgi:hypothetical protein
MVCLLYVDSAWQMTAENSVLYTLQILACGSPAYMPKDRHRFRHQSALPPPNIIRPSSSSCRSARLIALSVLCALLAPIMQYLPAMPKGAPKPTAIPLVSLPIQSSLYPCLSLLRPRTHETPVPQGEEAGHRVEGNVAARTLGVVVGRAHLARGGVETAASGGGREACNGAGGEHLVSC